MPTSGMVEIILIPQRRQFLLVVGDATAIPWAYLILLSLTTDYLNCKRQTLAY